MPNYIAIIPLRGGSKSIPRKNIKSIAGKPLCSWVLEAAASCKRISAVYVSTDCPEIEKTVNALGLRIKVIQRPAELATDEASTESVMLHAMGLLEFDNLITIQATSPLLETAHLNAAIKKFEHEELDSMLSAVRFKRFFWNDDGTAINYNPLMRPRRQEFKGTLMENGAFYITKKSILAEYRCRLGGRIGIYEMPEDTAYEIDEPEDWTIIERLLERRTSQ